MANSHHCFATFNVVSVFTMCTIVCSIVLLGIIVNITQCTLFSNH